MDGQKKTDIATMDTSENADGFRDIPGELAALARRIRSLALKTTRTLLDLGKELDAAQAILEAHTNLGSFSSLIAKAGVSRSHAYRAITAWRLFGHCENSRKQPGLTLHLLSKNEHATAEGLALIESGELVPIKKARQILAAHSPKKIQPDAPKSRVFNFKTGSVSVVVSEDTMTSDDIAQLLQEALLELHREQPQARPKRGWLAA